MNPISFPTPPIFSAPPGFDEFGFSFWLLLKAGLFMVALFLLLGALLQWLWNITMPQLFGLKMVTYWQALRLMLIFGILFGGLHFGR